jgi:hypothetical protein
MEHLSERLAQALATGDPLRGLEAVIAELESSDADVGSVSTILLFMEEHPDFDFGVPGPLVHFVERFYHRGYESELLKSLERQPTPHTVWMLNRLINGTAPGPTRTEYMTALRAAGNHPRANADTRQSVGEFLAAQDG